MEDKVEVGGGAENAGETDLSRAFESRREQWVHMMRGGAIKTRQDYTRYNTFVRPLVAGLDRNADLIWNFGARLPFLAANKAIEVIRAHVPAKTTSGK